MSHTEAWITGFQDGYLCKGDHRNQYEARSNEYWDYVHGYNQGLKSLLCRLS